MRMSQVLRALALIPIAAGLATVVFGTEIIRSGGASNPNVESELRYYAVFYVGFGLYLWSIAPGVASRGRELRWAAAVLFCGGLARAIGVLVDGWPEADYVMLMAVELVLPAVLVLWQRSIATKEDVPAR